MVKKFLIEKDELGEDIATLNPEYQKQIIKQKYQLYLKESDIPTFYHNIDLSHYIGDKESREMRAIQHYIDYCDDPKMDNVSLYLYGLHGTQKTALACNIGKEAMKKGLRVKFIGAGDLIDSLLKVNGFKSDDVILDSINKLRDDYNLLIIDDIFDEQKAVYFHNKPEMIVAEWDRFLRHVISNGVKVIMTSNFSLDIIKQKYGDSLFELIDRNFYPIQLTEQIKLQRKLNVKNAFKEVE